MNNEISIIQNIANNRQKIAKLIVSTVLLATGINILSSQLLTSNSFSSLVILAIGFSLCIISLFYLTCNLIGNLTKCHTFCAFLIYDIENKKIIPVPGYNFSEEIHEYLNAAFIEKTALKTVWEKSKLGIDFDDNGKKTNNKSNQLIIEAVQYFLLQNLSIHLIDYFADEKFTEENLKTYEREDIPDVLLRNRFLNLFSSPMEERSVFVEESLSYVEDEEEVVSADQDGCLYEKFEAVLPVDSIFKMPSNSELNIETKKIKMNLNTIFEGYSTITPKKFEQYYLNCNNIFRYKTFKIDIKVEIKIKLKSLLSKSGWEYYYWIDSFLDMIEKEVSMNYYFKSINWDTVLTIIHCREIIDSQNSLKNYMQKCKNKEAS